MIINTSFQILNVLSGIVLICCFYCNKLCNTKIWNFIGNLLIPMGAVGHPRQHWSTGCFLKNIAYRIISSYLNDMRDKGMVNKML